MKFNEMKMTALFLDDRGTSEAEEVLEERLNCILEMFVSY